MSVPHLRTLAARFEPVQPVLTDRFQHPESWLHISDRFLSHQILVQQRGDAIQYINAQIGVRIAERFGNRHGPSRHKRGEPPEEPLLGLVEQIMAPGDRAEQRLLTNGEIPRPTRQQWEPPTEPRQQRLWREQLTSSRRQLDGERQPIQPDASLRYGRGVPLGKRKVRQNSGSWLGE